jgi:hypothetical protein
MTPSTMALRLYWQKRVWVIFVHFWGHLRTETPRIQWLNNAQWHRYVVLLVEKVSPCASPRILCYSGPDCKFILAKEHIFTPNAKYFSCENVCVYGVRKCYFEHGALVNAKTVSWKNVARHRNSSRTYHFGLRDTKLWWRWFLGEKVTMVRKQRNTNPRKINVSQNKFFAKTCICRSNI